MTTQNPIPLETFASSLESLDTDAFATLVSEAYAATADEVAVQGSRITVVDGDRRTELLALSTETETLDEAGADAVVAASDSLRADLAIPAATAVVTPADLRQRLLYGMEPEPANAIAERSLGVPLRSASYDAVSAPSAGESGGKENVGVASGNRAAAGGPAAGAAGGGSGSSGETKAGGALETSNEWNPPNADARDGLAASRSSATDPAASERTNSAAGDTPDEEGRSTALVAAVLVVALVAAAAFGAAAAGGGLSPIGTDEPTDAADADSPDPDPTESATADGDGTGNGPTTDDSDETADGATTTSIGGNATAESTDEAVRATAVAPTCKRSALAVVQVQMNAFRYNDNATNDGLRAARAFSSPANKRIVGDLGQFVSLFELPSYAPMLTYDTAEYSVPVVENETARVGVVTRENGTVTGRYEFRLVRVPGGSAGVTDADYGEVDDCWMTNSVAAS